MKDTISAVLAIGAVACVGCDLPAPAVTFETRDGRQSQWEVSTALVAASDASWLFALTLKEDPSPRLDDEQYLYVFFRYPRELRAAPTSAVNLGRGVAYSLGMQDDAPARWDASIRRLDVLERQSELVVSAIIDLRPLGPSPQPPAITPSAGTVSIREIVVKKSIRTEDVVGSSFNRRMFPGIDALLREDTTRE